MLSLPPSVRLFVATQPVDGRKGADSLMVIVCDVFKQDPFNGHLFIFFSKRCDRIRVVTVTPTIRDVDEAIGERAVSACVFRRRSPRSGRHRGSGVGVDREGIDFAGARRRRRWEPGRAA
jgi:transposase